MRELIDRMEAITAFCQECPFSGCVDGICRQREAIVKLPASNAVEIPETGIGDLSDGYHSFNDLYYQRLVLTIALVKAYRDRAWKSWKHEDGNLVSAAVGLSLGSTPRKDPILITTKKKTGMLSTVGNCPYLNIGMDILIKM